MFVIPSKYVKDVSPISECVSAIRKFHPNERILIVDSCSEDDSYLEEYRGMDNVLVSSYKNNHYVCGSLYYAYKEYPNEHYYALIQDSIILKRSWDEFLHDDVTYNLMYFPESNMRQTPEKDWATGVIKNTDYEIDIPSSYLGIFGMLAVYKQDIISTMYNKGLLKAALPTNKSECQGTERVIGICLASDGYDIKSNSIEGNFLADPRRVNNDTLKYFTKFYKSRQ